MKYKHLNKLTTMVQLDKFIWKNKWIFPILQPNGCRLSWIWFEVKTSKIHWKHNAEIVGWNKMKKTNELTWSILKVPSTQFLGLWVHIDFNANCCIISIANLFYKISLKPGYFQKQRVKWLQKVYVLKILTR